MKLTAMVLVSSMICPQLEKDIPQLQLANNINTIPLKNDLFKMQLTSKSASNMAANALACSESCINGTFFVCQAMMFPSAPRATTPRFTPAGCVMIEASKLILISPGGGGCQQVAEFDGLGPEKIV